MPRLDLGALGLDRGGHLLVRHAMRALPATSDALEVIGHDPNLRVHLSSWARAQGLGFEPLPGGGRLRRTGVAFGRGAGAETTAATSSDSQGVHERPPARWGLAARGARVESG